MDVCRRVMELSLPDKGGVGHRFKNIVEDEVRMSAVFEPFVRNFYRPEQKRYSVAAETISWPAIGALPEQIAYPPEMITDVTLRPPHRMIVIDAKFYLQTFAASRFGGAPKVRSVHLYQLGSYLEHSPKPGQETATEGVLLYPSTDGVETDLDFKFPRHRLRVCTGRPGQDMARRAPPAPRRRRRIARLAAALPAVPPPSGRLQAGGVRRYTVAVGPIAVRPSPPYPQDGPTPRQYRASYLLAVLVIADPGKREES